MNIRVICNRIVPIRFHVGNRILSEMEQFTAIVVTAAGAKQVALSNAVP